jgi:hypothetical protein
VIIFVDKERLTALCNAQWPDGKIVNGGDMNTSRGFLVEIDDLLRGII